MSTTEIPTVENDKVNKLADLAESYVHIDHSKCDFDCENESHTFTFGELFVTLDDAKLTRDDMNVLNAWVYDLSGNINYPNAKKYIAECEPNPKYEHIGLYPKNTFHWNALLLIVKQIFGNKPNAYHILIFYTTIMEMYGINLCSKALRALLKLESISECCPCVGECLTSIYRIISQTEVEVNLVDIRDRIKFYFNKTFDISLVPEIIVRNTNFREGGGFYSYENICKSVDNFQVCIRDILANYYTFNGFVRHPYYGAWFDTQSNIYKILYKDDIVYPDPLTVENVNKVSTDKVNMMGIKIASIMSKNESEGLDVEMSSFLKEHYNDKYPCRGYIGYRGRSYNWEVYNIRDAIHKTILDRGEDPKKLTLDKITGNAAHVNIRVPCIIKNELTKNRNSNSYVLQESNKYQRAWLLYVFQCLNGMNMMSKFNMIPELDYFLRQSNVYYKKRLDLPYTIVTIHDDEAYNGLQLNASNEHTITCLGNTYTRHNVTKDDVAAINNILTHIGLKRIGNMYILKFIINCITLSEVGYLCSTRKDTIKLYKLAINACKEGERRITYKNNIYHILL